MNEMVILVDEHDTEIGREEKLAAHQKGLLHRAFSVFVFNAEGETLIQKRAAGKYHSGGLWSNTCCSHPAPGESNEAGAHRRLREEMGFDCELRAAGSLLYKTAFENGLTEHEYDHMFVGTYEGAIERNPLEVEEWKWIAPAELIADMKNNPDIYTYWFRLSFEDILSKR